MVRGVRFLVDETGRETAVQMGLESRHRSGLAPTRAVTRSGILCHVPVRGGGGVRTIQELLGHRDVTTTMISTHVSNRGGQGVRSPLDAMPVRRGHGRVVCG